MKPDTLGNYVTYFKGFAFKSKWYVLEGHPIIKVSDFLEDSINCENLSEISLETAKNFSKYGIYEGDIIIQTVGSWPDNPNSVVGKVVRANSKIKGALLNQNAVNLIPKKGIDKRYLFFLLKSELFKGYIINTAQGAANQASITLKSILNFKVQLPPLSTQQRIASILSAYDDLIEVNNQRIKLLEQTARELYKEWFVRMRFPGYQQAKFKKGIPDGWVTEKFEKHIKVVRGKSYTSQEIDDNNGEYPFINLKNMNRGGGFRLDGIKYFTGKFKKEQIVIPGDIVMAVTDMTQDRLIVGRVARVPLTEHKEYVISLDIAKIISIELPPEFLYSTLRFNYYGESLAELANGTNVLHLSPDLLKKYSLLIPPQSLTESFSEKVKPIYDLMDVLAIQNNQCRQIRDRLLPRLISGKLQVKETSNKKAVMA